jgi:hypothetical protein
MKLAGNLLWFFQRALLCSGADGGEDDRFVRQARHYRRCTYSGHLTVYDLALGERLEASSTGLVASRTIPAHISPSFDNSVM